MTYQEFKEFIKLSIQKELGSNVTVTIQDIIKNNNTHLDGLTVFSSTFNISPTIYLNYYYKQYEAGRSIELICQELINTYKDNQPKTNIDISFFTCYEKVKSNIVFKLINYERNSELLKDVPHFRFLDLAIVFHCLLRTDATGNATILIHNHHLTYWNITQDDLYALATANTPRLLPYDLRSMTDVLKELMIDETDDVPVCPMYMLTNHSKLNGSVCILYHNLLKDFANRIESDLFILPSSVHEVLIIPAMHNDSYQELSDMVKEVNSSQLTSEEILSDHVYYFSRATSKLTM